MRRIVVITVITFSFLVSTCSQESNPVDSNTPVVDPITNTWTSQADPNYRIFFNTFDSTTARGVFWGTEFNPNEGDFDLCGFFDKFYVEFDVQRPVGGRIKFTGKFINSNRMELQSSEGSLVLTR